MIEVKVKYSLIIEGREHPRELPMKVRRVKDIYAELRNLVDPDVDFIITSTEVI